MKNENEYFVISFFPETASLENLFQVETRRATSLQKTKEIKKIRIKKESE